MRACNQDEIMNSFELLKIMDRALLAQRRQAMPKPGACGQVRSDQMAWALAAIR
jgi:hypothetical protein